MASRAPLPTQAELEQQAMAVAGMVPKGMNRQQLAEWLSIATGPQISNMQTLNGIVDAPLQEINPKATFQKRVEVPRPASPKPSPVPVSNASGPPPLPLPKPRANLKVVGTAQPSPLPPPGVKSTAAQPSPLPQPGVKATVATAPIAQSSVPLPSPRASQAPLPASRVSQVPLPSPRASGTVNIPKATISTAPATSKPLPSPRASAMPSPARIDFNNLKLGRPQPGGLRPIPPVLGPEMGQRGETVSMPTFTSRITAEALSPKPSAVATPVASAGTNGGFNMPRNGAVVSKAYTAQQASLDILDQIDPSRINPDKTRKGDNSYDVKELKEFVRNLGLKVTGNKKELAERLMTRLREMGRV